MPHGSGNVNSPKSGKKVVSAAVFKSGRANNCSVSGFSTMPPGFSLGCVVDGFEGVGVAVNVAVAVDVGVGVAVNVAVAVDVGVGVGSLIISNSISPPIILYLVDIKISSEFFSGIYVKIHNKHKINYFMFSQCIYFIAALTPASNALTERSAFFFRFGLHAHSSTAALFFRFKTCSSTFSIVFSCNNLVGDDGLEPPTP